MNRPHLQFIRLHNYPILKQLQLEEALLRTNNDNWCLFNEGSSPAIVMGISGKPEQLLNLKKQEKAPLPLIRRFSGGGTVVVDENTLFVTFICNAKDSTSCCPEKVLKWSEELYESVFPKGFQLKENDYVIENRKFGGNAQYFRKERWLHHSSLLWDYSIEKMDYLLMPPKTPKYREKRHHVDFLCSLREYEKDKQRIEYQLSTRLSNYFIVKKTALNQIMNALDLPHRKATQALLDNSQPQSH